MKFYSTNSPSRKVDFKEAVFNSFPPDKGLYMPEEIPALPTAFIESIGNYSLPEIAFDRLGLTGVSRDVEVMRVEEVEVDFVVVSPGLHEAVVADVFARERDVRLVSVAHCPVPPLRPLS